MSLSIFTVVARVCTKVMRTSAPPIPSTTQLQYDALAHYVLCNTTQEYLMIS